MHTMLPMGLFPRLSERDIRKLKGGPVWGRKYFIASYDGNTITGVFYARLENNRQSQKLNSDYPAGYQPFDILGKTRKFDIKTSTFQQGVIQMWETTVSIKLSRVQAAILKTPPEGSEMLLLLKKAACRTDLEEKTRRAARLGREHLIVAGELLQEIVLKEKPDGVGSLTPDLIARFELYVKLVEDKELNDLLELLRFDPMQSTMRLAA